MTVSEQFNTGASACSVGTTCTIRILISSYNCPTYCQATFWYSSVPPRARCGFVAGLCGLTPSVWRAAACKVFSRAHPQPGILAKCLSLRRCRPWHLGGRRVSYSSDMPLPICLMFRFHVSIGSIEVASQPRIKGTMRPHLIDMVLL